MNRINPFDNLYLKQGLEQTKEINSPQKMDEQNPSRQDSGQKISEIQKSDENDFVDISSMVDDTEGFDSKDFNLENKNDADGTSFSKEEHGNLNQDDQNEENLQEQINEYANKLLEKQN